MGFPPLTSLSLLFYPSFTAFRTVTMWVFIVWGKVSKALWGFPLQVFQQTSQLLRFPSNLIALEVRNLKEPWQSLIEIRQAQDLLDLLANPFVIGNGVGPARDKHSLEERADGVIEAIEGLEIDT